MDFAFGKSASAPLALSRALGGALAGPFVYSYDRLEVWNLRDYNFVAAVRIEAPGKPPVERLCFDQNNFLVLAPADPKDETQRRLRRRESLDGLLKETVAQLGR